MRMFFRSIVWPWQYKKRIRELEDRIIEMKVAGWDSVCESYWLIGKLQSVALSKDWYDDWQKTTKWNKCYSVFARDNTVDPKDWVKRIVKE